MVEIGNDDVDRTVFVSASNNPDVSYRFPAILRLWIRDRTDVQLLPPFPSFPPIVRASLMHLRAESKARKPVPCFAP